MSRKLQGNCAVCKTACAKKRMQFCCTDNHTDCFLCELHWLSGRSCPRGLDRRDKITSEQLEPKSGLDNRRLKTIGEQLSRHETSGKQPFADNSATYQLPDTTEVIPTVTFDSPTDTMNVDPTIVPSGEAIQSTDTVPTANPLVLTEVVSTVIPSGEQIQSVQSKNTVLVDGGANKPKRKNVPKPKSAAAATSTNNGASTPVDTPANANPIAIDPGTIITEPIESIQSSNIVPTINLVEGGTNQPKRKHDKKPKQATTVPSPDGEASKPTKRKYVARKRTEDSSIALPQESVLEEEFVETDWRFYDPEDLFDYFSRRPQVNTTEDDINDLLAQYQRAAKENDVEFSYLFETILMSLVGNSGRLAFQLAKVESMAANDFKGTDKKEAKSFLDDILTSVENVGETFLRSELNLSIFKLRSWIETPIVDLTENCTAQSNEEDVANLSVQLGALKSPGHASPRKFHLGTSFDSLTEEVNVTVPNNGLLIDELMSSTDSGGIAGDTGKEEGTVAVPPSLLVQSLTTMNKPNLTVKSTEVLDESLSLMGAENHRIEESFHMDSERFEDADTEWGNALLHESPNNGGIGMDGAMSDEDTKELEDLIQEDDEGLVDTSISEGRNVVDILPLVQPSILTGTTTEIIPAVKNHGTGYFYFKDRATEPYEEFKEFFPQCTNVYGIVQLSERQNLSRDLILCTGDIIRFRSVHALPKVFVFGVLNDLAAEKDELLFPPGTSSMCLFLIDLEGCFGMKKFILDNIAGKNTDRFSWNNSEVIPSAMLGYFLNSAKVEKCDEALYTEADLKVLLRSLRNYLCTMRARCFNQSKKEFIELHRAPSDEGPPGLEVSVIPPEEDPLATSSLQLPVPPITNTTLSCTHASNESICAHEVSSTPSITRASSLGRPTQPLMLSTRSRARGMVAAASKIKTKAAPLPRNGASSRGPPVVENEGAERDEGTQSSDSDSTDTSSNEKQNQIGGRRNGRGRGMGRAVVGGRANSKGRGGRIGQPINGRGLVDGGRRISVSRRGQSVDGREVAIGARGSVASGRGRGARVPTEENKRDSSAGLHRVSLPPQSGPELERFGFYNTAYPWLYGGPATLDDGIALPGKSIYGNYHMYHHPIPAMLPASQNALPSKNARLADATVSSIAIPSKRKSDGIEGNPSSSSEDTHKDIYGIVGKTREEEYKLEKKKLEQEIELAKLRNELEDQKRAQVHKGSSADTTHNLKLQEETRKHYVSSTGTSQMQTTTVIAAPQASKMVFDQHQSQHVMYQPSPIATGPYHNNQTPQSGHTTPSSQLFQSTPAQQPIVPSSQRETIASANANAKLNQFPPQQLNQMTPSQDYLHFQQINQTYPHLQSNPWATPTANQNSLPHLMTSSSSANPTLPAALNSMTREELLEFVLQGRLLRNPPQEQMRAVMIEETAPLQQTQNVSVAQQSGVGNIQGSQQILQMGQPFSNINQNHQPPLQGQYVSQEQLLRWNQQPNFPVCTQPGLQQQGSNEQQNQFSLRMMQQYGGGEQK